MSPPAAAAAPDRLVLVFGTHTEVGKTWVGGQVLGELRRRGHRLAARKPAESFDPAESGPRDSEVLGAATGEDADEVCPPHRRYEVAMAPPMAAEVLGRPAPRLSELVGELGWPPAAALGWLETVGGPRSPIAVDGDGVDLGRLVRPHRCLLVADAGLGVVNAVLLCTDALVGLAPEPPLVVLNRFDPDDDLHRRNRRHLAGVLGPAAVVVHPQEAADALDPHGWSPAPHRA